LGCVLGDFLTVFKVQKWSKFLQKMGWATFWAIFSTIISGHPGGIRQRKAEPKFFMHLEKETFVNAVLTLILSRNYEVL
jgi:hypothetical protein